MTQNVTSPSAGCLYTSFTRSCSAAAPGPVWWATLAFSSCPVGRCAGQGRARRVRDRCGSASRMLVGEGPVQAPAGSCARHGTHEEWAVVPPARHPCHAAHRAHRGAGSLLYSLAAPDEACAHARHGPGATPALWRRCRTRRTARGDNLRRVRALGALFHALSRPVKHRLRTRSQLKRRSEEENAPQVQPREHPQHRDHGPHRRR